MAETFRVGDLACVVRTCCAGSFADTGGLIAPIAWIQFRTTTCRHCPARNVELHAASAPDRPGVPLRWLKRIDPHPDAGSGRHDEELFADA